MLLTAESSQLRPSGAKTALRSIRLSAAVGAVGHANAAGQLGTPI
jgi:hypothetical protein